MPYFYKSGQQILKGDHVLLCGNPGEIEFVADPEEDDSGWYVRELGGGFMILEAKVFGRLFLRPSDEDYHELVFLRRGGQSGKL